MTPPAPERDLRSDLLAALLDADAARARRVIDGAADDGVPVEQLYLEVIAPAMHEVGVLWERAEISVAEEHLATAITQRVLVGLAGRLRRPDGPWRRPPGTAVTGAGPGDHHSLGTQMVADFLSAAGWRVLDLGAATPPDAFASVAAANRADVVCVSTSLPEHLPGVRSVREALDALDPRPLLAVGGLAYAGEEGRAGTVGADVLAADPGALLRALDERPDPVAR